MTQIRSAASPAARAVLRLLIALNWLYGAVVLALLIATVVAEQWILSALGVSQTSMMRPILPGLRTIARVLLAFVLAHVFAAGTRMGEELAGTV